MATVEGQGRTPAPPEKEEEDRRTPAVAQDTARGWVMVVAMFACTTLVFGLIRSLGVFFVEFVQYFEESAQAISWITSIGVAVQQLCSPLGTALCNAYDAQRVVMAGGLLAGLGLILASQAQSLHHLYLTMGLISGLGWALVFTPMLATVMAHFTRRRTLALGVGFSGVGLSSLVFSPLFQYLVEAFGWRGALLLLGGLSLHIVACGALIRPPPRRGRPPPPPGGGGSARRHGLRDVPRRVYRYLELGLLAHRPFMAYSLAVTFFNAGYFVPYVHLVAHGRQAGFSEYRAALIVGMARMVGALGLLQLLESVGGLLGTPFSGYLRDLTGNYNVSLVVAGCFFLLGSLILLTLPHYFSCNGRPTQKVDGREAANGHADGSGLLSSPASDATNGAANNDSDHPRLQGHSCPA
ncbi:hypothetical protein NHX12_014464 [Muraenolepis orangiensis]|uniref:Monocarboxylate transporter 13 n=1 Tax=Muraenolepis orangiensis TaxID=630683 RepID=A0A9Q0I579_9TELE|nr:hypothetical protein NHX12_014464 [Muraenolepis orangiensis]